MTRERRLTKAQRESIDSDAIGWVGWDARGWPVIFTWVKWGNIKKPLNRTVGPRGELLEPVEPITDNL